MQNKQLEQALEILKENDFSVKHWENYGKERYYITSDRFRLNVFISIEENGIFLNTKSQSETKAVLQFIEEILDTEAITEKIGCLFRCEKRVPLFFIEEKEQENEEVAEETATETVFEDAENEESEKLEDGKYEIYYIHGEAGFENESKVLFELKDNEIYPISIENERLTEEEVIDDLDYRLILKTLKKSDKVEQ